MFETGVVALQKILPSLITSTSTVGESHQSKSPQTKARNGQDVSEHTNLEGRCFWEALSTSEQHSRYIFRNGSGDV